MATKQTKTTDTEVEVQEQQQTSNELAEQQATGTLAVSNNLFEADAGSGMEGADRDSFAIPFLMILQKGSPQVDETHPQHQPVEGAKAGALYDNISQEVFDGKLGVRIVPCAFRRVFIRWGSDESGEGFKGEYTVDEVAAMRERGEVVELENRLYFPAADGSVHEKKSDRLSDTRNHYILLLDDDGGWKEALLSLSSTQIKKSKMLMAMLANVKLQGKAGKFTPPTYANVVRMSTVPESNDKGSWYGARFEAAGQVQSAEIYAAAKNFNKKVSSGAVVAKYEEAQSAPSQGMSAEEGF